MLIFILGWEPVFKGEILCAKRGESLGGFPTAFGSFTPNSCCNGLNCYYTPSEYDLADAPCTCLPDLEYIANDKGEDVRNPEFTFCETNGGVVTALKNGQGTCLFQEGFYEDSWCTLEDLYNGECEK